MAGHSHWANIAHKKALIDNKRGKLWSKLSKAIIVAAKSGGGDVDMNLKLRYAIDAAKAVSMPKDNIQRAIKRGTGELDGGNSRSALRRLRRRRRGRAVRNPHRQPQPHGRRDSQDLRSWPTASSAPPAAWPGCSSARGCSSCPADKIDEDTLLEFALEAGADDVKRVDDKFEITCDPSVFAEVGTALSAKGITPEVSQITRIPNSTIDLDAETARKVLKLMEKLDDHDDVQNVSANFNIPEEAMAEIER